MLMATLEVAAELPGMASRLATTDGSSGAFACLSRVQPNLKLLLKVGVSEPVRIDVGYDEGRCLFPNRIVAAHENNTAPH